MIYDFDKVVDRSNNHSAKYDELTRKFGREDVIPMWIADMDFMVPEPIIKAMEERNKQGIFGYTSRPDSYFDAVCNWQKRRNGWEIDKTLCGFNVGVVSAIYTVLKEFSNKNDKILFLSPAYTEFFSIVENAEREVLTSKLVNTNNYYTIDFEDFECKLKLKPKIFILCNPHNPVGRVWKIEELKKIGELCLKYNVLIISDEIHSDLVLWGNKHIPFASISKEFFDNTITCVSATKTFNLAGLQASTTIYPNQAYKEKCELFWKRMDITRNNCFSVVAMEAAFNLGEEWLEQLIPYIEKNILFVKEFIDSNIPQIKTYIPESTYLMWLDCREMNLNQDELANFMINKAFLGLGDGKSYGVDSGYMRMNVACPRVTLEKAMENLRRALNHL